MVSSSFNSIVNELPPDPLHEGRHGQRFSNSSSCPCPSTLRRLRDNDQRHSNRYRDWLRSTFSSDDLRLAISRSSRSVPQSPPTTLITRRRRGVRACPLSKSPNLEGYASRGEGRGAPGMGELWCERVKSGGGDESDELNDRY